MKWEKPEIRIRRMKKDDIPKVVRIERQNFSDPWKPENFAYYLERENAVFLIAEEKRQKEPADISVILGYIGLITAADEGDITNVSVAPECRGLGIGTRLLKELLSMADADGTAKIFLEVRESNAVAIRLYSNAGFRKVGIRKRYYTEPDEDAILMCHSH